MDARVNKAAKTITPGEALRLLDIEHGDMPNAKPFKDLSPERQQEYERRAKDTLAAAWQIGAKMKEHQARDQ